MAIDQDVLVIGGGLAGATAALGAAENGARTRLVSGSTSTLRHASGLVDVLGYTPTGEGPLAQPFDAIPDLPADHPYRVVGPAAIREGLDCFDQFAGNHYRGDHSTANALVPTGQGAIKPTARYPASVAQGLAGHGRDILLVGFTQLPAFDAPLAAASLDEIVEGTARGITVDFPVEVDADATVTRFAHLLDENPALDKDSSLRKGLGTRISEERSTAERVGFPAVLGRNHPAEVRAAFADALECPVFEVPLGPPSVPGIRLADLLGEALDDAGILRETGNDVVDAVHEDGRIESVALDRNGATVSYTASQFVLATGGLVGGGVETGREHAREPIFGCHVATPADRYDWFEDDAFGDHRFAQFGIRPDTELRPLDGTGAVEFENLRAAGAVLGNYDFAAEKSGSGVSLATGYRAGTLAGEMA